MRILVSFMWNDKGNHYGLVPEWAKSLEMELKDFDPQKDRKTIYLHVVKWTFAFVWLTFPYSVAFNGFNWNSLKGRIDKALDKYAKNGVGQGQYEFFPGAKLVPYTIRFRFDNKPTSNLSIEDFAFAIIDGKVKCN